MSDNSPTHDWESDELDQDTVLEISRIVSEPYEESIFKPLTQEEVKACVKAMTDHSGIAAASDRLHAQWARHIASWIKSMGEDHE